jgi:hypothetical protein
VFKRQEWSIENLTYLRRRLKKSEERNKMEEKWRR